MRQNRIQTPLTRSRGPLCRSRIPPRTSETASENKKSGRLTGRFFCIFLVNLLIHKAIVLVVRLPLYPNHPLNPIRECGEILGCGLLVLLHPRSGNRCDSPQARSDSLKPRRQDSCLAAARSAVATGPFQSGSSKSARFITVSANTMSPLALKIGALNAFTIA